MIATSLVFTKDVAMLSRDVAMLVLTLLDVKSLSRLKRRENGNYVTNARQIALKLVEIL